MTDNTPTTEDLRLAWWMHVDNPADNEGASDVAFFAWLEAVQVEQRETDARIAGALYSPDEEPAWNAAAAAAEHAIRAGGSTEGNTK